MKLENIVDEVKRIGSVFIPFSSIYYIKNYSVKGLFGKTTPALITYVAANILTSFSGVLLFSGYLWMSVGLGTVDYRKWPEIQREKYKEQSIQRTIYEKEVLEKSFNYFDSNHDGVVSKVEFKEAIEKTKGWFGERSNYYDEINWDLNLDVDRVDIPNKYYPLPIIEIEK